MSQAQQVKVAVVQAASQIFDTPATVQKACGLIREAGSNGAKIMLFPEAFIGGYPQGLAMGARLGSRTMAGRKDYRRYYENAIMIPGPETDSLGRAVSEAGAYVIVGVIEKEAGNSTVYCTALIVGPDGQILGKHRKLKATAAERYIWGEGDGSTMPVFDTPYGRIGTVICWENYMPLVRSAMYGKGVDIYLAPTNDQRDIWQISMRHIAHEGRVFVLSCCPYMVKSVYPTDIACYDELADQPELLNRGGSAIINPYGDYLAGPIFEKEGIEYATLDLGQLAETRYDFDVAGHYTRPDVMKLVVNEQPYASYAYEKSARQPEYQGTVVPVQEQHPE